MSEWNAGGYYKQSALQKWLAEECLGGLEVAATARVLDVGCGDGKITAEIADRLPGGSILGIDPSTHMIEFARAHFTPSRRNLEFQVGDAALLTFQSEFDLIVSFNALHWVTEQDAALRCIRNALGASGRAVLQFVPQGDRRSLEDVLEDTRASPRWAGYFTDYCRPFVHLTADEYRASARRNGLRLERSDAQLKVWDFKTREAFTAFAEVTFVEWTRMIPAERQLDFISDVLDAYRGIGDGSPGDANVFHFYQMKVVLRRT